MLWHYCEKNKDTAMQFLRTRLASHLKPFAIVVIILLQLQSIYVAFSLNSNIEQRTNSYLDESALLASAVIDQRIVQVVTALERLATMVSQEMKRMDADAACDALLHNYKKTWQYSDLFLLAPDGTELVRAVHDISGELEIARRALERKSPAFGKSSLSDSITYAIPVFDGKDVVAVLMCSRGTEKAHQLLEVSVMANAGFIILVDYDKNVLVKKWNASREDLRGKVNFLTADNKLDTSVFGPDYDLHEHGHAEFKGADGKTWLLAQRSKKEFGLALLYVAPADVLMQNIPSLRWWNTASNFISFVLILFLMGDLLWLQRAYQRKIDEVEFGDVLTHGDNSAGFSKKLKKLLDNTSISYALITLDINKFKLINDEYGVTKANEFLRLVHDILSDHLVSDELCARHNADTFLLLLHFSSEDRLRERLDGMMNEVMLRKHALGMQHKYGLSAGVYVITDRNMPPYIMVDNANFAREQCKKPPHPSCVFYDESVQEKLRNEADILNSFTYSLEHDCFEIWLQPKVNIRTDIVIGAEALVRWNHPEQGFLSPAAFLPVLEQNNRIVQLDLWVFEEVCRMLARWPAGTEKEGRSYLFRSTFPAHILRMRISSTII